MVQELLTLLPQWLTTPQVAGCIAGLIGCVFLWLVGSAWSRGIVTLLGVALGGMLGAFLPRWQVWPINSMAAAVLGAVGFGVGAFLMERVAIGVLLGVTLAAWAALATWTFGHGDQPWQSRPEWEFSSMTVPQQVQDVWERMPEDVRRVMPFSAGMAMFSGLVLAIMWPRLGRGICFSVAGVTGMLVFCLALLATRRIEWLRGIPESSAVQGGVLLGLTLVGILAQWQVVPARKIPKPEADDMDDDESPGKSMSGHFNG